MKRKKILATLLVIAILIGNIIPLISYAEGPASVKIVNAEKEGKEILVEEGETFTVNVLFSNPTDGAKALTGFLQYDTSKLEIQNSQAMDEDKVYGIDGIGSIGEINMVMYDTKEPEKVSFTHINTTKTILNSGTLFPLTFKVKENATGTFDIKFLEVKYTDGKKSGQSYQINIGNPLTGKIRTPLKSIKMDKEAVTIGVNESDKLSVIYTPDNTTDSRDVTWKSLDKSIVDVDDSGNIKGIAPGTADITATSTVSGVNPATCKVTVTSKLLSISIDKSTLNMSKGDTAQLKVNYTPKNTTDSKNITWSSNKDTIASVDRRWKSNSSSKWRSNNNSKI